MFSLLSVTMSKDICEKINWITFPRLTIVALKMHGLFQFTIRLAKVTLRMLLVTEIVFIVPSVMAYQAQKKIILNLKKLQELNFKTLAIYSIIFQPTISELSLRKLPLIADGLETTN